MTSGVGGRSRCSLKTVFAWAVLVVIASILFLSFKLDVLEMGRNLRHQSNKRRTNKSTLHIQKFNMRGNDVMVFVHIQKTGGTQFGLQLVRNLDIERPCQRQRLQMSHNIRRKKRFKCLRPGSSKIWLISRHHLGWPCGLHADWTESKECVSRYMNSREGKNVDRSFSYVTIIREPVSRFLSEFSFVHNSSSTWSGASLRCNGRSPSRDELPLCFAGKNLSEITLKEFMGCPWNLAINRQSRMLADLRLVNCYDTRAMPKSKRNEIILQSAKRNLQKMAYFALMEYQEESQFLFEKTFGLKFLTPFKQVGGNQTKAGKLFPKLNDSVLQAVKHLSSLDVELYTFAKKLFLKRVKNFKDAESRT